MLIPADPDHNGALKPEMNVSTPALGFISECSAHENLGLRASSDIEHRLCYKIGPKYAHTSEPSHGACVFFLPVRPSLCPQVTPHFTNEQTVNPPTITVVPGHVLELRRLRDAATNCSDAGKALEDIMDGAQGLCAVAQVSLFATFEHSIFENSLK